MNIDSKVLGRSVRENINKNKFILSYIFTYDIVQFQNIISEFTI